MKEQPVAVRADRIERGCQRPESGSVRLGDDVRIVATGLAHSTSRDPHKGLSTDTCGRLGA